MYGLENSSGECIKDVPNCCTTNAQCGKCETCDLVTNTCNKDVPNCCSSNAQCPLNSVCENNECRETPTLSHWGMGVLALLLLAGITIKFDRRRAVDRAV